MADLFRTQNQNITAFADNTSGLISAQDGRNFIDSVFPYLFAGDPTVNADKVNTAGLPNATGFDTGSWWVNALTGRLWWCQEGPIGAAIWWQIAYIEDVAPSIIPAFLTSGPTQVPLLAVNVAVEWGSDTNLIKLVNPSDLQYFGLGMYVDLSPSGNPGYVTQISDPSLAFVLLDSHQALPGAVTATCTPVAYEWVAGKFNATTGEVAPDPAGPVHTVSTGPAFSMDNPPFFGKQSDQVWIRPRGIAVNGSTTMPVYDFVEALDPEDAVYNSLTVTSGGNSTTIVGDTITTVQVTTVNVGVTAGITFTPVTGTPPAVPGTLYTDSMGDLEFVDSAGHMQPVTTGLSGSCKTVTGTTTSAWVTVQTWTASNGLVGGININNVSGGAMQYRFTTTDFISGTIVGAANNLPVGVSSGGIDCVTSLGFLAGGCRPPVQMLKLEVQNGSGGSVGNYKIWWNVIAC